MFSSSRSPRSKSATPNAGASPISPSNSITNGTAYPSPKAYPYPNAYTQPAIIEPPTSTSTPPGSRMRATPRPTLEQRDSVLRASILDTALELGVGTNSAVEKWMFGPIGEVDEEPEEMSPSLTYASTATSDDSWLHSSTSSSSQQSAGQRPGVAPVAGQRLVQFAPADLPPIRDASFDSTGVPTQLDTQFDKKHGKKLRKPRPSDGYTSDGGDGYVSESGTPSKTKAKKEKASKKDKKEKGEESEGGYLSDVLSRRRRGKDKDKKKGKAKPGALNLDTDVDGDGEDTDGGYLSSGVAGFVRSRKSSTSKAKSKAKSKDGDTLFSPQSGAEDSDGGYLSSSSVSKKRRFFRLKRGDSEDSTRPSKEFVPPVPALPKSAMSPLNSGAPSSRSVTPLPIAERFASRANTPLPRADTATPTSSMSLDVPRGYSESSRSTTPVSPLRASESSEQDRLYDRDRLGDLPLPSPNPSMTSLGSPRLTHAFKDAESIRTPSVDVLRAFGRQAGLNLRDGEIQAYLAGKSTPGDRSVDDGKSSMASTSYGSLRGAADARTSEEQYDTGRETPVPSSPDTHSNEQDVPTLNLPSPGPKIKRTFSKKQTPTPMTVSGPGATSRGVNRMDIRSIEVLKGHAANGQYLNVENGRHSAAGDKEGEEWVERDLMVDVTPATPSSGRSRASESTDSPTSMARSRSRSPSRSPSPSLVISTNNSMARPTALGKYDLPPPSPPPQGPLPQVPPSPTTSSPAPLSPVAPSSSRANLAPAPLVLNSKGNGKASGQVPTSPLGKSSFTPCDVSPPAPIPSPSTANFISRKLSKRPGTAPASPGSSNTSFTDAQTSQSQSRSASNSASSSPPTTGSSSRLFGFGRSKAPPRPGTAPTVASAPPTAFNPSASTAPLALRRVESNSSTTSIQRGRESPFPSKPILQLAPGSSGPRAVSPIQPASASAALQNTSRRSDDVPNQTLDVNWQPRSASALSGRQPAGALSAAQSYARSMSRQEEDYDDRSSWVDFDDSPPASQDGHRKSVESYESSESRPDIESVLETLNGPNDERSEYDNQSRYSYRDERGEEEDEDEDDPRERETAYYTSVSAFTSDNEDAPVEPVPPIPAVPRKFPPPPPIPRDRYSTSPSPSPSEFDDDVDDLENRKSRASIMDPKRSGKVREKLMRRVEAMRRNGGQDAL